MTYYNKSARTKAAKLLQKSLNDIGLQYIRDDETLPGEIHLIVAGYGYGNTPDQPSYNSVHGAVRRLSVSISQSGINVYGQYVNRKAHGQTAGGASRKHNLCLSDWGGRATAEQIATETKAAADFIRGYYAPVQYESDAEEIDGMRVGDEVWYLCEGKPRSTPVLALYDEYPRVRTGDGRYDASELCPAPSPGEFYELGEREAVRRAMKKRFGSV